MDLTFVIVILAPIVMFCCIIIILKHPISSFIDRAGKFRLKFKHASLEIEESLTPELKEKDNDIKTENSAYLQFKKKDTH